MKNNFKETMNLPKTGFSMRANLPQNEPGRLKKWEDEQLYFKVLEKNKDGKPFILHDGPPYANGPIHIGHAFNKILKDFVVKSYAQRGYYTPYVPGWDCHGQPIEHMVEVTLGPEKMAKIDQATLRRLCRDWATKYVGIQRDGFKRLGVNANWDNPYLTYQPNYESGNVEVFKKMYLDGAVYRGRKPIHWCKRCHTALAEAEIEYSNEISNSIFVKFALDAVPAGFDKAAEDIKSASVLIWTTTPWTLPANTAVSVAPDAMYVLVNVAGEYLLMASALVEQMAEVAGWEEYFIVCDSGGKQIQVSGKSLLGATYDAPLKSNFKGQIIYGDHVSLDTGTGCVHTAPGHGQEDYMVALEFDVPLLMPVDDNGCFTTEVEKFAGMDISEANPLIIDHLEKKGSLEHKQDIDHSYPHCWRCKQPVIFRATDQWFVSMENTGLRARALEEIKNNVTWIPAWASNRIGSMVSDRPDWCISRQRSWGVPIPVFKCAECNATVANEATFDAVIELFNTKGADAWFTDEPSSYLPKGTACEACGSTNITPEKDILDVWWESGVSHTSVCKHRAGEGLQFPADMYLEGSDQHRGWFQSSLLTSVGAYGHAPYKEVMHCGFTMDAQGKKMSKSAGNGVDPADVVAKVGADVLRLWVASVDYSQDVNIGDEILERTSDTYRRIRNTLRFLMGNLHDFNVSEDAITRFEDLNTLDAWALARVEVLLGDIEAAYKNYKFHHIYRSVYEYIVTDLSAIYMDACKDRLYSEAPKSKDRRSAQTVLAIILDIMVKTLSPILSFTCDEAWENYPEGMRASTGHEVSVQLAGWPDRNKFICSINAQQAGTLLSQFETVLSVRDDVTRALEAARSNAIVNKSQEAFLKVSLHSEAKAVIDEFAPEFFQELFIVSAVEFIADDSCTEEAKVEVLVSSHEKCERCWNYREVANRIDESAICARCESALNEIDAQE